MTISSLDLVRAGYKQYKSDTACMLKRATMLYQKDVRIPDGPHQGKLLYYVNWYEYDFSELRPAEPVGWSAEVQFYRGPRDQEETVDVEYHVRPYSTVEQVEQFFHDLFVRMDCLPDTHND